MKYEDMLRPYRQIHGELSDRFCMQLGQSGFSLRGIRAVGIGRYTTPYSVESFAAPWHLALFVIEGRSFCETATSTKEATVGDLLIIPAQIERRLHSKKAVSFLWMHLKDDDLYRHLHRDGITGRPEPSCEGILRDIAAYRGEMINSPLIAPYHEIIGEKVYRLFADPALNKNRTALQAVMDRIRQHPEAPWTVDQLAEDCRMSKGYFHRLCHDYLGTTPMRLVLQMRLEKGAVLLRTTTLTIEAVAADCGFGSARAFSLAFQREHGERPGQFRRSE